MLKRRNLNFEERLRIEELIKDGITLPGISLALGRGKNTIIREIRTKGGRENYNAIEAQRIADEINEAKKQKLSKLNKENPRESPVQKLGQRIDMLEMHIDILFEQIKEIQANGYKENEEL